MKTLSTLLILLTLCTTSIISCKKYEEGGPRNRKAEQNLTKEWSRERAFKNGTAVSQVQENPQIGEVTENMYFNSDGTYKSENGSVTLYGTWKLINKNKQVEITITSPSNLASTYAYDIIKLTEGSDGEFIFGNVINGNTFRFECRSSS